MNIEISSALERSNLANSILLRLDENFVSRLKSVTTGCTGGTITIRPRAAIILKAAKNHAYREALHAATSNHPLNLVWSTM
jgi:hypothetical protein